MGSRGREPSFLAHERFVIPYGRAPCCISLELEGGRGGRRGSRHMGVKSNDLCRMTCISVGNGRYGSSKPGLFPGT